MSDDATELTCGAMHPTDQHRHCGQRLGRVPASWKLEYLGVVKRYPGDDGTVYIRCACGAVNRWAIVSGDVEWANGKRYRVPEPARTDE